MSETIYAHDHRPKLAFRRTRGHDVSSYTAEDDILGIKVETVPGVHPGTSRIYVTGPDGDRVHLTSAESRAEAERIHAATVRWARERMGLPVTRQ